MATRKVKDMMDDYNEKYPLFSNFMCGIWNQTADLHYPDLQTAVHFHLVSFPFHMQDDFLNEMKAAAKDDKFLEIVNHKEDRFKLANIWGGRTIDQDALLEIQKIAINYVEHRKFKIVSSSD